MDIEIGEKEFNFLVDKVKDLKSGERTISLADKVQLFFRYCTVKVGDILEEEVQFPVLNKNTALDKITSLVFDAKGLHGEYVTEIEVFKENKSYLMYIVPHRDYAEIQSFRKLLLV